MYRRLEAVLWVAETGSVSEAARRVHVLRFSVRRWAQRYLKHHDLLALAEGARTGRPRLGAQVRPRRWRKLLASDPRHFGYRASSWTAALLGAPLRTRLGVCLSDRAIRRRLHEQDLRYKRPRHRYRGRATPIGPKKGGLCGA